MKLWELRAAATIRFTGKGVTEANCCREALTPIAQALINRNAHQGRSGFGDRKASEIMIDTGTCGAKITSNSAQARNLAAISG